MVNMYYFEVVNNILKIICFFKNFNLGMQEGGHDFEGFRGGEEYSKIYLCVIFQNIKKYKKRNFSTNINKWQNMGVTQEIFNNNVKYGGWKYE